MKCTGKALAGGNLDCRNFDAFRVFSGGNNVLLTNEFFGLNFGLQMLCDRKAFKSGPYSQDFLVNMVYVACRKQIFIDHRRHLLHFWSEIQNHRRNPEQSDEM